MSFRFNLQPMKKPFSLALIIVVLALVSCSGDTPSPDGGIVNPGGGGTPSSHQLFSELYGTDIAAEQGVFIVDTYSYSTRILPSRRGEYEAEYQLVTGEYNAELKALYEIKDQISSEEYYTRLYEAENKANLARAELDMRWQGMAVWEDSVVYARLRNSSGSVRRFRYVIWIGDSFTGQGTMFFSNMVELPARSDDLYVLTIDTGNRYVGGYSIGCEVT